MVIAAREQAEIDKLPELQRMELVSVVKNNQATLRTMAKTYDVPYEALVKILHHEFSDTNQDWLGIKDAIQNDCASQGTLKYTSQNAFTKASYAFQLENNLTGCNEGTVAANRLIEQKTARADLDKFFAYRQQDQEDECDGKKHPVRNGNTEWFFNSLGIAQLQVYVALGLAIDGYVKNPSLVRRFKDDKFVWHLSNVARVLADDDAASIELLAGELWQARREWYEEKGDDLNQGLALSRYQDFKGSVSIGAIQWLLSTRQASALRRAAKRLKTEGSVKLKDLVDDEKKALPPDLRVPAADAYLQLHLRGNFRAYARLCPGA